MPSKRAAAPPPPRLTLDERAHVLLARAGQWAEGRDREGRTFYAIPSQTKAGIRYLTDGRRCECPSFQIPVGTVGTAPACVHMRAVQLHRAATIDSAEELAAMAATDRTTDRAMLARAVYIPVAQEILAHLTPRQKKGKKYRDIFYPEGIPS